MKNCNAPKNQPTRRILPIACATALAVAFAVSLPRPRWQSHTATRAAQPQGGGRKPCVPRGSRRRHPELRLRTFSRHLASPMCSSRRRPRCSTTMVINSSPTSSALTRGSRAFRPAWQHSRDTSTVWAEKLVKPSSDPNFVAPGAIPWLWLHVVAAQEGPTGGHKLRKTTFIQRPVVRLQFKVGLKQ